MQVYPSTGKLRLARATPSCNNIDPYSTRPCVGIVTLHGLRESQPECSVRALSTR
jgi:hypothetical protein